MLALINDKAISNEIKSTFNSFIKNKKLNDSIKKRTIENYQTSITQFFLFLNEKGINGFEGIDDDVIVDYKIHLKNKYKISTANQKVKDLKAYLNYIDNKDMIATRSYRELTRFKTVESTKCRAYTKSQCQGLLEACNGMFRNNEKSVRNKTIIMLALNTGLRLSEVVGINVEDVNFEDKSIEVFRKKTNEVDFVPVDDNMIGQINLLVSYYSLFKGDPLFCSSVTKKDRISNRAVQGMFKKVSKKVTNDKELQKFHALRKTFGTQLLRNGVSVYVISRLLNHKNIETTKIYLAIDKQIRKNDRKLIENLF